MEKDGGPHEERGPAGDGGPDFGSRRAGGRCFPIEGFFGGPPAC